MSNLYIRVMTGFYTHRKTAMLKLALGNDAYWIPPRIWAYCAENQPDGNLSGYSAELLASLIGYTGNAQAMLQALLDACLIDAGGTLHDWAEHNGYHKSYSERAKVAANARWEKERERKEKKEAKKRTEERGNRKEDSGDKHCSSNAPSIDAIYNAYPKKVGKPKALVAIRKAVSEFGYDAILQRTIAYAQARKSEDPQFTPMPATWFNQQRFNDDPKTWANGKFQKPPTYTNNI